MAEYTQTREKHWYQHRTQANTDSIHCGQASSSSSLCKEMKPNDLNATAPRMNGCSFFIPSRGATQHLQSLLFDLNIASCSARRRRGLISIRASPLGRFYSIRVSVCLRVTADVCVISVSTSAAPSESSASLGCAVSLDATCHLQLALLLLWPGELKVTVSGRSVLQPAAAKREENI